MRTASSWRNRSSGLRARRGQLESTLRHELTHTFLEALAAQGRLKHPLAEYAERLDREIKIIQQMKFSGYFLIVWDIVEFCRRNDIFCQGRGSAANSAVCFALGITKADAVSLGLLFERLFGLT